MHIIRHVELVFNGGGKLPQEIRFPACSEDRIIIYDRRLFLY